MNGAKFSLAQMFSLPSDPTSNSSSGHHLGIEAAKPKEPPKPFWASPSRTIIKNRRVVSRPLPVICVRYSPDCKTSSRFALESDCVEEFTKDCDSLIDHQSLLQSRENVKFRKRLLAYEKEDITLLEEWGMRMAERLSTATGAGGVKKESDSKRPVTMLSH